MEQLQESEVKIVKRIHEKIAIHKFGFGMAQPVRATSMARGGHYYPSTSQNRLRTMPPQTGKTRWSYVMNIDVQQKIKLFVDVVVDYQTKLNQIWSEILASRISGVLVG